MKKYREDGSVMYYYYKKKRGRKKKRGPKKVNTKEAVTLARLNTEWNFKIIKTNNRKQIDYVGIYHNLDDIQKEKEKIINENNSILFPVEYISKGKQLIHYDKEYVILKRIKDTENDDGITILQDKLGKLVKHKATSEKWKIYDIIPCLSEEKFWVYGFNPKRERKPLEWIYTAFIDQLLECSTTEFVRISIYNNKVIFTYDNNDFNFVICKNISDAIRMYNILAERYSECFNVLLIGNTKNITETVNMIHEKTGWDKANIYRTNTVH